MIWLKVPLPRRLYNIFRMTGFCGEKSLEFRVTRTYLQNWVACHLRCVLIKWSAASPRPPCGNGTVTLSGTFSSCLLESEHVGKLTSTLTSRHKAQQPPVGSCLGVQVCTVGEYSTPQRGGMGHCFRAAESYIRVSVPALPPPHCLSLSKLLTL